MSVAIKTGVKVVVRNPGPLAPWALERLTKAYPEANIVTCTSEADMEAQLVDAEVLIGGFGIKPASLRKAPKLKWVQTLGTGVEHILDPVFEDQGIILTNTRGCNVVNIAEHVIGMMLSFARGFSELHKRQSQSKWLPLGPATAPKVFELNGSRVGIVGYGEIGRAIAKLARGLDMEVWATRRTNAPDPTGYATKLFQEDGLGEVLSAADHVVIATPSTPGTKGMIGAAQLAQMKPTAYIYNIARGDIIDQDAMIAALKDGKIAGAGLDTTTPEPLPPESPLWTMPNVIVTGHTSGSTPRYLARVIELAADNLSRYRTGEPLIKVVDLKAGY